MLDAHNWVRWRAPQLRDWFQHIVAADLEACNKRARMQTRKAGGAGAASAAAEQVRASASAESAFAGSVGTSAPAGSASAEKVGAASSGNAESTLVYRTTNAQIATVDNDGMVHIVGPGTAEIYAYRQNAAGRGPEMRMVTIVADAGLDVRAQDVPGSHAERKKSKAKRQADRESKAPKEKPEKDSAAGGKSVRPANDEQVASEPASAGVSIGSTAAAVWAGDGEPKAEFNGDLQPKVFGSAVSSSAQIFPVDERAQPQRQAVAQPETLNQHVAEHTEEPNQQVAEQLIASGWQTSAQPAASDGQAFVQPEAPGRQVAAQPGALNQQDAERSKEPNQQVAAQLVASDWQVAAQPEAPGRQVAESPVEEAPQASSALPDQTNPSQSVGRRRPFAAWFMH